MGDGLTTLTQMFDDPSGASFERALLDVCPDEIIIFDITGRIVYANEAATRQRAQPPGALSGRDIRSLFSESRATQRLTVMGKVTNSGLPIHFTERCGDEWTEVLVCPLPATGAGVGGVATFTRTITQQIRAEERLKLATLQLLTIQEDERRRIAQDLHDDIGQSMTALILELKAIQGQILDGQEHVEDQVKQTIHTVEDMMRHVRQVFHELHPPSFAVLPLAKVLETLCSSLSLSTGLRVVFSSQPQLPRIPDAQATALYRLVQEGIHNVVKHAKATSVWINLDYAEDEVNLSVEDDGLGFDPSRGDNFGMGLEGIRERFRMLSGNFDIDSAPGKGTRIYGSLPIPNPSAS